MGAGLPPYWAMNLYMISPACLAGAVLDAENLDILAARIAKFLRHSSSDDTLSMTFAFIILPELSTVMATVTSPPPIHR